jgi:HSP20 family protein
MAWDHLSDLVTLHDRSLQQPGRASGSWSPPVDVFETPAEYRLVAELPGFSASDFAVNVTPSTITLSGRRPAIDVQAEQYLRLERGQGAFTRVFTVPEPLDAARVTARFELGLLTVTVAKATDAGPRRIAIG